MAKYGLGSYLSLLNTLGKTTRQIWQAVKKHPKFRNSTNANIENTLANVRSAADAAKELNKSKSDTKVNRRGTPKAVPKPDFLRVSYKFKFAFPDGSKSGKKGSRDVHGMIDVDYGLTKKEIFEQIKEKIQEWMEEHYEEAAENRRIPTPRITSIIGV